MHFYSSYKLDDVLSMRADLFFTFLNTSYRLSASFRLEEITVASVPYMEKEGSKKVLDSYRMASQDILDITDEDEGEDYDGIEDLKKLLK